MILCGAAPIETADIQSEFSGIKWGANISNEQNLKKISRQYDVGYYVRPGEEYTFNNLNLGQIIYAFYRNKFFAAYLKITTRQDFDEIKKYLIVGCGSPRAQLRMGQTIYIWEYGDIKIKLKQYENEKKFKLAYYYLPLSAKLNEIRLEKNAEISMQLVPEN